MVLQETCNSSFLHLKVILVIYLGIIHYASYLGLWDVTPARGVIQRPFLCSWFPTGFGLYWTLLFLLRTSFDIRIGLKSLFGHWRPSWNVTRPKAGSIVVISLLHWLQGHWWLYSDHGHSQLSHQKPRLQVKARPQFKMVAKPWKGHEERKNSQSSINMWLKFNFNAVFECTLTVIQFETVIYPGRDRGGEREDTRRRLWMTPIRGATSLTHIQTCILSSICQHDNHRTRTTILGLSYLGCIFL